MIISKTPFRISFFGGGTDYPIWYQENGGAVISTSIDKYCWITARYLPPFFEHKYRIVYSKIENAIDMREIKHPVVKAALGFCKIDRGVEIHHDGDLPARSGLGSSSSFTVGLLSALYALKGVVVSKEDLANQAIHIERDILKESVGSQDQIAVTYGGFNKIVFRKENDFYVEPITVSTNMIEQLQNYMMLVYTGIPRLASKIAVHQIRNTPLKKKELHLMREMVNRAMDILNGKVDVTEFGRLLHESWQLKKKLSSKISNTEIDNIYARALKAGAIGGKLLGAGGGGFLLLFVPPENYTRVKKVLKDLLEVKFAFENEGTRIVHYSPQPI